MDMPVIGSIVCVTTKYRNINYATYENEPYKFQTLRGVVVKGPNWMPADSFQLKVAGEKWEPIIANSHVDEISVLSGSLIKKRQYEVIGSKGDVYLVNQNGDHYDCTCTGFKFNGRCRHIVEARSRDR